VNLSGGPPRGRGKNDRSRKTGRTAASGVKRRVVVRKGGGEKKRKKSRKKGGRGREEIRKHRNGIR